MRIEWQIPQARSGLMGKIDMLIGPGATQAEKNLQLYIPVLAGLCMVVCASLTGTGWIWWQYLMAFLLTFDIVGGIITNATSSAKRWFHRKGEGFRQHITFIALHFIQLTLFSFAFLDMDIVWVLIAGSYMLFACALVLKMPLYLQRPVALALYSCSLLLALYYLRVPTEFEWFLPLFYLKLLVSHILREEPYRPENEHSANR